MLPSEQDIEGIENLTILYASRQHWTCWHSQIVWGEGILFTLNNGSMSQIENFQLLRLKLTDSGMWLVVMCASPNYSLNLSATKTQFEILTGGTPLFKCKFVIRSCNKLCTTSNDKFTFKFFKKNSVLYERLLVTFVIMFIKFDKFCRVIKTKGMVFRYTWVYSKEDTMAHTYRPVVTR